MYERSHLGSGDISIWRHLANIIMVFPAFTMAPNCVDQLANKNLEAIEDPFYPEYHEMMKLLHYLAYCQYRLDEMRSGLAWKLIEGEKLYDEAIKG